MKPGIFAIVLIAAAAATTATGSTMPGTRHRRDSYPEAFELPSNATLILGNIVNGFDCNNLPYGYYADTANGCFIFHICLPYINFGDVVTRQFSFFCGEGTVFDQERLVCDFPEYALPCEQAPQFVAVNEYFGRTERNFLE